MNSKIRLVLFAALSLLPGFAKKFVYRTMFGASIGSGVRIGFAAVLCFDTLTLESGVRIGSCGLIRVSSLTMGKRASIGSFTRVACHTVKLGSASTIASWVSILADHTDPQSRLEAGSESWIFDYCYINPTRGIKLGRNVGVGGGSYLFTHGYWLSKLDGFPVSYGEINIDNDVWLPWGCFIMPGVDIGSGVVVGARSLVTKSIPAGALAAGSPAKIIREVAAAPMTLEARNKVLIESAEEFARFFKRSMSLQTLDEWTRVLIDNEALMVVSHSETPGTPPTPQQNEFCVAYADYWQLAAKHPRAYSIKSYQCCASDQIGDLQSRWLNSLRQIGVRHYPIDEVRIDA